ncbi:asparagine synthase (glutamine-hydrolysing) [Lentzea waywayandensis]|uniref:asparagine synthase (glutamine-hydrolyzing) n=1 Tax=Lentzea waywayandensis TaxID=84724 RepID=A0A1I6ESN1_9PSEU|nr:albusnodin/ikarugamycin family macrolactam cyclase [Lentzea waywayandensis]SFR20541.1 asparagine synthase (glutamine-hydrolysing) [Lentzea waywayandensis]
MPPARVLTRTPDASAEVFGQCFAEEDVLARSLAEFTESGEHRSLTGHVGCYSAIVRQPGETTLFADPVGQFPLYYDDSGRHGTKASDLGTDVDRVYLATRLACLDGAGLLENRSLYQGVRRVREGHALHVGNGQFDERPYAPLRVDPDLSEADAAEMLRDALVAAVRARALSARRLVSDFSGGLDSTSIACLALRDVPGLSVFTHYNPDAPVLDDVERAERYVSVERRFDHQLVKLPAESLPFQDLLSRGDEPHPASIACGPARLRFSAAAALGADVHLMGEGGDSVLWAPGAYFVDLARRGELTTLWRHCFAWARLRNRSPLSVFRRAVFMAGLGRRGALLRLARALEQGHAVGDVPWEVSVVARWDLPQVHWFTRSTRHLLAAQARLVAGQESDVDAGESVVLNQLRLHGLTQQVHREAAAEVGIAAHAPFLDTAVVRAAMAIPARRRADPAVAKPLLKKALAGLVPDRVLSRETKGDYSREAYQGIRRAAPELRRLLSDSAAADFGLIDPVPVRQVLEDAVNGLRVPWGALNQVLAVEVWLRANARKVAST